MFGFYIIKRYEMRKLYMSCKQTSICLTFDPYSVYTKCENGCGFVKTKPQSIITTALQWS